ncbi:Protein of unknown function [Pyronema omphalodes CBS 100304]|uniref:Uncharacterized protein n=1 Tax=Pyronema omphalodes (strain CBS 100304) TaxID=1076935 RepID=U4LIN5_PYROM|nr:Protein of unknown function [Pyronema omphalodes CBS 100304]
MLQECLFVRTYRFTSDIFDTTLYLDERSSHHSLYGRHFAAIHNT